MQAALDVVLGRTPKDCLNPEVLASKQCFLDQNGSGQDSLVQNASVQSNSGHLNPDRLDLNQPDSNQPGIDQADSDQPTEYCYLCWR